MPTSPASSSRLVIGLTSESPVCDAHKLKLRDNALILPTQHTWREGMQVQQWDFQSPNFSLRESSNKKLIPLRREVYHSSFTSASMVKSDFVTVFVVGKIDKDLPSIVRSLLPSKVPRMKTVPQASFLASWRKEFTVKATHLMSARKKDNEPSAACAKINDGEPHFIWSHQ